MDVVIDFIGCAVGFFVAVMLCCWWDTRQRYRNKLKMYKVLNEYPCTNYLHNALRFIADGKPDVAYKEICHAILKSGGELSESETKIFKGATE